METVDIKKWFTTLFARARAFGHDTKRSPEFVWKTLLTLFVLGGLGVLVTDYLIFYSSDSQNISTTTPAPHARDVLNVSEIKQVLQTYEAKTARLNDLYGTTLVAVTASSSTTTRASVTPSTPRLIP